MAKWQQFPDASAEVERLRVELEQARALQREIELRAASATGHARASQFAAEARADRLQAERDEARKQLREMALDVMAQAEAADRLQAERDDLAARLQQIQQAERKYTAAKLTEAAKMRKGQAI